MPRTAYILAALLFLAGSGQAQVQRLKIGGNDGLEWESNSLIFNAIEVTADGTLSPLEADPEENILPRIKELGGSATPSLASAPSEAPPPAPASTPAALVLGEASPGTKLVSIIDSSSH